MSPKRIACLFPCPTSSSLLMISIDWQWKDMDDIGTKLAKELTLDVNMQFTRENLILTARNNGPSLLVENAL